MPAATTTTAADLKQHLAVLHQERLLAMQTTLADDLAYMSDLELEIFTTRHAYIGSAVTEIASLRGVVDGRNFG